MSELSSFQHSASYFVLSASSIDKSCDDVSNNFSSS